MTAHYHDNNKSSDHINRWVVPIELEDSLKRQIYYVKVEKLQEKEYFNVIQYESTTEKAHRNNKQPGDINDAVSSEVVPVNELSVEYKYALFVVPFIQSDKYIHNQHQNRKEIE